MDIRITIYFLLCFVCMASAYIFIAPAADWRTFGRNTPNFGEKESRTALIIGNKAYKDKPLKNPVNDALSMKAVLEKAGFHVILKTDQDKNGMHRALADFGRLLKPDGIGLFYYAGHAVQIGGENYMIPIGSDIKTSGDIPLEAVGLNSVLLEMGHVQAKAGIVIIDACRGNPFDEQFNNVASGLTCTNAPPRTIIAHSASPGQDAKDGRGNNSLYTSELVRYLEVPGLRISDVFYCVRRAVRKKSGGLQAPVESTSLEEPVVLFPDKDTGGKKLCEIASRKTTVRIKPGEIWVEPYTGMRFAGLPEGCFQMGCVNEDINCRKDELPVHDVCLEPFGVGVTEVTNSQFAVFLNHVNTRGPENEYWFALHEERFESALVRENGRYSVLYGYEDYPVASVSWHGAAAFAEWLSDMHGARFQLPSEAQWEYACRSAGKNELYSGGANPGRVSWNSSNSGGYPHPVATKAPNGAGLFDMSGNVWEWCRDKYGSGNYDEHPRYDPVILFAGSVRDLSMARVIRGGGHRYDYRRSRCSNRGNFQETGRSSDVGFRMAVKFTAE